MSADDIQLSSLAALAGAVLFFFWGRRMFEPDSRRWSYWTILIVTHVPILTVGAYVFLVLPSEPDGMRRIMTVIWATCGFMAGGFAGLIFAGLYRIATRRSR